MKKVTLSIMLTLLSACLLQGFVTSLVYSATQSTLEAIVEVQPQELNLKSVGNWTKTYIELPEGYDVANINVPTILLNNTIPVDPDAPTAIGDYDEDGVPDLMVCFNRTQLIDYIISMGIEYDNATLAISGELFDGTPFEGNAVIKVSSLLGDANCDGKVNIHDIVIGTSSYDAKEDEPNWNPNANYAPPWNQINIFDLVTMILYYEEET